MNQLNVTISPTLPGATFTIFRLQGHLDAQTLPQLESRCREEPAISQRLWIMDLSKLEYISSAGLGCFVGSLDKLRGEGGDILFVGVPQKIRKIFDVLGFSKIFRIFEDEGEALRRAA